MWWMDPLPEDIINNLYPLYWETNATDILSKKTGTSM